MKPSRPRAAMRVFVIALALAHLGLARGADGLLQLLPSPSLSLAPRQPSHASTANNLPPDSPVLLAISASLSTPGDTRRPAPPTSPTAHWASQAQQWVPGLDPCDRLGPPPWDRLSLSDALSLSLCKSPTLRQALANVAEQHAGLSLAEAAQRPSWSLNAGASAARNFIAGATPTRSIDASLNLSWMLFDFGRADADLDQARQTLAAALATQGNILLESIRELLQQYGDAVVADAAFSAAEEAETTARLTAAASQARYEAGVGNQIDRLQAQTALAQATLTKVRADSDWEIARGKLALSLGADITQPLRLAHWEPWSRVDATPPDLAALRREARAQHPRLRAARAELDALQAQLASVQASARGSVALSAIAGHASNWGNNGTTTTVSNVPSTGLSVTATIPLFNRRASDAQQARVLAQMTAREAELEAVQRDVDALLWQAHRALLTSAKSVEASERLLTAASSTHEVAQGRYKAGVGSMVDLLTAQAALADARRQRVAALVDRITAQTQLSLAAGRLGQ